MACIGIGQEHKPAFEVCKKIKINKVRCENADCVTHSLASLIDCMITLLSHQVMIS